MEGTMRWHGGETWYRVEGSLDAGPQLPVVILHGGPGLPHDYLEPIAEITATTGRPCVLYDQLGCGRSQHLPDAPSDFWTVELFCREATALAEHLGIAGGYHLLGQSWGGMLALEHAAARPAGLRSLIAANTPASIPLFMSGVNRLRTLLPPEVQEVLDRHEAAGTTDDDEYWEAVDIFCQRHLCRIPYPEPAQRAFAAIEEDSTVYDTMWGPSELVVTGTLAHWDVTPRLSQIEVPVLVISGEHDEATPDAVRPLVDGLPGARWELVEGASHFTHLERPEEFLKLVTEFLAGHDPATG